MIFKFDFKGKHAMYIKELTDNRIGMFNRNIDVVIIAPIIGVLFNRKSDEDKSKEKNDFGTKIVNEEQINKEIQKLEFGFRLVTLCNSKQELEDKVKKAFRDDGEEDKIKDEIKSYYQYLYGGIEILHEKIIGKSINILDIFENTYNFLTNLNEDLDSISEKYNDQSITDLIDEIMIDQNQLLKKL